MLGIHYINYIHSKKIEGKLRNVLQHPSVVGIH